ncbi:MAG: helix-turn-helix domain-containing protein [Paracoccus sp. (in: a-proteobacteria)]|uniref:helix-turn-helix domain-containing protein n=1 Tax=Paracoccus sp. TaxID=267 RepID=UPI0026E02075|nr:helix-turn-helix domain-containing protein [Paracoccus sp. (in: a-proteobacteria)]MDO5632530.1 helix-turn-helix domain-containing protein [Paracoccus sp. (in: a-proteobacteria)]
MEKIQDHNLTVADVAAHYNLSPRTVRQHLKDGALSGVRIKGEWRCSWRAVWRAEMGPMPRGERADLYRRHLMSKKTLAAKWGISERTVERWIADGLPTRNVFGSVRIAPFDAEEWTNRTFGITNRTII